MKKWYILGVLFDVYCPELQAKLYRDLLDAKNYAKTHGRKLLVACPDETVNWLLSVMDISYTTRVGVAKNWLVYSVDSKPDAPDFATNVTNIKVTQQKRAKSRMSSGPTTNPFALTNQGRDATFMSLRDRPAPNGYTPHSPANIAIFFGT